MTRVRRPTLAPQTIKFTTPEIDGLPQSRRVAALVVMQGSAADIGVHVRLDGPVTVGRDPLAELPLEDGQISRRHCQVSPEGGFFVLEDLQSTNGTLLNGNPVADRIRLGPGDRIALGTSVIKFTLSDDLEIRYHEQMDRLVGTDDLTDLMVRRRFDAALARELESCLATENPLAVLMMDLDGLKQINDSYGHPVGAHTIGIVGHIVGECVAPHGSACRPGGDEFMAFLRLSKAQALVIGEAVRARVGEHTLEIESVRFQCTISVGVSAFPDDGRTALELLTAADEALYRAKQQGGNRVEQ